MLALPILLALMVLLLIASPIKAQPVQKLSIFAAASLQTALDGLAKDWESAGHAPLSITYAGSPTLAQQIDKGAPADLFISADQDWMDWLVSRKQVSTAAVRPMLGNSLVLIAPARDTTPAATGPITRSFDIAAKMGASRLAMADPHSVPAGKYAKAALEHLGFWPDLSRSIAPFDNVRLALIMVARGEATLGIVYRSDAISEPRVKILGEFDTASHPAIIYPAAIITRSKHPEAPAFMQFLVSGQARQALTQAGFVALTEAKP